MVLRLLLGLAFTIGFGAKATACSCAGVENKSVSEHIYGDLIFVGRPINSRYEPSNDGWQNDRITTFEVERRLQGELGPTIEILHGQSGASCGVQFILGEMQVISAHKSDTSFQTGLCSNPLPSMVIINYFEKKSNPVLKSSTSCFDTGGLVKSADPMVYNPWSEPDIIDPDCKLHTLAGKVENHEEWEKWLIKNTEKRTSEKKRRWWSFNKD